MQIQTTVRYHLTKVRMDIIKNLQTINSVKVVEKKEPSYTLGEKVNWHSHYGKHYGSSLKLKVESILSNNLTPSHISDEY